MFGSNTGFGGSTFGGTQQRPPVFGQQPTTGTGGFGSFGQATATPTFGASTPAFGAPSTTTPTFGATTTPAFGASATPAFGAPATTTGAFGAAPSTTSAFGASTSNPSTFGSTTPSSGFSFSSTPSSGFGFGSTTTQQPATTGAFGSTTPAFGSTTSTTGSLFSAPKPVGAFGSTTPTSTFGGTTLGQPSFGSTPTQSTSSSLFGSTQPSTGFGFGGGGGAFGAAPTTSTGFGGATTFGGEVKYTKTTNEDNSFLIAITAMPAYRNKSFEELRLEDYNAGKHKKGPGGVGAPTTTTAAPAFGAAPTSTFGAPATSTTFGAPASAGGTPSFSFSTSTTPSGGLGSTFSAPAQTSTFGASSTPAFGAPASTFGAPASNTASSPFGASTATPAFGSAPTSTFGAGTTASTSTFSFGATPSTGARPGAAFGTSTTPIGSTTSSFGAPATSPAPFSFGGSTTSNTFGSPAPNQPAPTSNFAFSSPAQNTSSSLSFTQPTLFGSTTPQTPAPAPSFSFSTFNPSTPAPGSSTPSNSFSFGASPSTSSFGFGAPGQTTSMFGTPASSGAMTLGVPGQPAPPASPYGTLPPLPFNMDIFNPPTPTPAPRPKKVSSLTVSRLSPRPAKVTPRFFSAEASHKEQITNSIFRSPSARPGGKHLKTLVIDPNATSASPSQTFGNSGIFNDPSSTHVSPGYGSTQRVSTPVISRSNGMSRDYSNRGDLSVDSFEHSQTNLDGERRSQVKSNGDFGDYTTTSNDLPIRKPLPPDYYLVPSWDQIQTMTSKDLQNVPDFRIGRSDCGSVLFLGKTDIRNVDVAKMVIIKQREIEVYPNDNEKPPVGTGLNKPAQVTLEGIRPRGSKTPQKIEQSLRKYCENKGLKFIAYDPSSGSWTFEVQHFSKYNYESSDDESEPDHTTKPVTSSATTTGQTSRRKLDVDEEEFDRDSVDYDQNQQISQHGDYEDEMLDDGDDYITNDSPDQDDEFSFDEYEEDEEEAQEPMSILAQQGYAVDPRIQLHSSILFGERKSQAPVVPTTPKVTPFTLGFQAKKRRASPLAHQSDDEVRAVSIAQVTPISCGIKSIVQKKEMPSKAIVLPSNKTIPLARSFRVSWGPDGRLARPFFSSYRPAEKESVSFSKVAIQKIPLGTEHLESQSLLITQLKDKSFLLKEVEGWPEVHLHKREEYVDNVIRELTRRRAASGDNQEVDWWLKRLQFVWKLVKVLFFGKKTDSSSEIEFNARRSALGSWLSEYVADTVNEQVSKEGDASTPESIFRVIFNLLTGKRIGEAAVKAYKTNNPRLGTLIAQVASYNNETSGNIKEQIASGRWKIDPELHSIYRLLAGDFESVAKNLDWPRSFGLFLWYGKPANLPIETVIEEYEESAGRKRVNQPKVLLPPHSKPKPGQAQEHEDIFYRLLQLYTTQEHALMKRVDGNQPIKSLTLWGVVEPSSYTINSLDYHLAWHLFIVLSLKLPPRTSDFFKLTANYSHQLELSGHWQWAIYVYLLHPNSDIHSSTDKDIRDDINVPACREKAVEEILLRHLADPQGPQKLEEIFTSRFPSPSPITSSITTHFGEFRRLISRVISWGSKNPQIPTSLLRSYEQVLISSQPIPQTQPQDYFGLEGRTEEEVRQRVLLEFRNALKGGELMNACRVLIEVAPICILKHTSKHYDRTKQPDRSNHLDFLWSLFSSADQYLPPSTLAEYASVTTTITGTGSVMASSSGLGGGLAGGASGVGLGLGIGLGSGGAGGAGAGGGSQPSAQSQSQFDTLKRLFFDCSKSRFLVACLEFCFKFSGQQPRREKKLNAVTHAILEAQEELNSYPKNAHSQIQQQRYCLIEMSKIVARLDATERSERHERHEYEVVQLPLPEDYRYNLIDKHSRQLLRV